IDLKMLRRSMRLALIGRGSLTAAHAGLLLAVVGEAQAFGQRHPVEPEHLVVGAETLRLIAVIVAAGTPDARAVGDRDQDRFRVRDGDVNAAAIAIHAAMGDTGRSAHIAGILNRAAIAGGIEMRAALAEGHAEAQLVSRLVAVGIGLTDVLLRMLGEMGGIVDAAEAGVDLPALQG